MPVLDAYGVTVCAVLVVLSTLCYSRSVRDKLPLPPGPRKHLLVGNIFDLPAKSPWKTYEQWSKQYASDIIHLDLAGTSVVILSSWEATDALLNKHSVIYSDSRFDLPMVADLMGFDFNIGKRIHRRLFNQAFNITASERYRPQELKAAHVLLTRLLKRPDAFLDHLRQTAGEVIMSVTYGINVLPVEDPYMKVAEEAMQCLTVAAVPGKYLVDAFPILKYVPRWFPGAKFKRLAEEWRKLARDSLDLPFAETKHQVASGIAPPSFNRDGLQALNYQDPDVYYAEHHLKATAGTMFAAGSDATVSALVTFVLAMLANPEAQQKAQAEIDSVTGGNRLPNFEDELSTPYISALIKEVLPWENVTPIDMLFSMPHRVIKEDEYRGYRIPAGSLVICMVSSVILHDQVMYPDPTTFNFLLNGKASYDIRDPDTAFGFGRRRCPGRHMAMSSFWITINSVLATFNIQKAVDEEGNTVNPRHEYVDGLVSMPLSLACSITPRSREGVTLIEAIEVD
ncbi:cytochrome P450 [Mycena galericulata]|nr:cytochrome P450 [Mycena galericulata]